MKRATRPPLSSARLAPSRGALGILAAALLAHAFASCGGGLAPRERTDLPEPTEGVAITPEEQEEWIRRSKTEDHDEDGIADYYDNCSEVPNPYQHNDDDDAFGDACDACPQRLGNGGTGCPGELSPPSPMTRDEWRAYFAGTDWDGDGVQLPEDNCPVDRNPDQKDEDGDGWGDRCDHCPREAVPHGTNGCVHRPLWGAQTAIDADPVGFCKQTCGAIAACPIIASAYSEQMLDSMQTLCERICENQPTERERLIEVGRAAKLYTSGCDAPYALYPLLRIYEYAKCDQSYCHRYLKRCGPDEMFDDEASCLELCRTWPLGDPDATTGHSISCRAYYALRANGNNRDLYCEAASSSGGDTCVGTASSNSR